ncbi:hypothetical protein Avbf_13496 [Armadillidium vulgare]|nr:hypothetical protein Avbf_13496 [Armadillidium vulgare]
MIQSRISCAWISHHENCDFTQSETMCRRLWMNLKSKLDISNEKIMYELSKSETEKSKLESLLDEELKTSDKYNEDILKALTLLERNTNRATSEILESHCLKFLNYETDFIKEDSDEIHEKLITYVLNTIKRDDEGRIIVPLLWKERVSHLLGKNEALSKSVLNSNYKKFKDKETLFMINNVFIEQEQLGIIERVDFAQYKEEFPNYSFLAHMPVFKLDRASSKCRNVFLSNICENNPSKAMTVSHNQAMYAGPCLNKKISTTITKLRFNEKLLCFDIQKAFLNLKLSPTDQSKLLFHWFKNVEKGDFSLVVYKHNRLSFGLKPSPFLLLMSLYYVLILNVNDDSQEIINLKRTIYDLLYMDNCAFSSSDSNQLKWAFCQLDNIFSPYKISLQQFVTNDKNLQDHIDKKSGIVTPPKVKFFGLIWDRDNDMISASKLKLDVDAETKRLILSSIASNFDILLFNGPLLNRARLFMHNLKSEKDLDWDTKIPENQLKEWKKIAKQVNASGEIQLNRCFGRQNDDYKLIAFTDSSKMIYDFLTNSGFNIDQMEVIVPNPVIISTKPLKEEILCNTATTTDPSIPVPITNFGKFSSFHRLVTVCKYVLEFINKLKLKLKIKNAEKFSNIHINENVLELAQLHIILSDQHVHCKEVLDYLNSKNKLHKDMPNIVSQLNLFKDEKGLLRVKSKFNRYKDKYKNYFPILLHKNSPITEMIILDMHKKTSHANFEFIVAQTIHLVNRRPVAFKEALRDSGQEDIPAAITPEILLKGHELISLNIIPNLQPDPETEDDIDISWTTDDTINHIKDSYEKLKKVRSNLIEIYNSEFLSQLAQQATDRKSRYMPKTHSKLEIGDIVLIKEPFLKPSNYPMGKVEQVQINVNNEVTGATLLKGNKERIKRHVSSLIPLLKRKTRETTEKVTVNTEKIKTSRPQRKAAIQSKLKTALLYDSDSV